MVMESPKAPTVGVRAYILSLHVDAVPAHEFHGRRYL